MKEFVGRSNPQNGFILPSSPFTLLQDAQYGDGGEDGGLLKHLGSRTPVGGTSEAPTRLASHQDQETGVA